MLNNGLLNYSFVPMRVNSFSLTCMKKNGWLISLNGFSRWRRNSERWFFFFSICKELSTIFVSQGVRNSLWTCNQRKKLILGKRKLFLKYFHEKNGTTMLFALFNYYNNWITSSELTFSVISLWAAIISSLIPLMRRLTF